MTGRPDSATGTGAAGAGPGAPRDRDAGLITIVMPARNEADGIAPVVAGITRCVRSDCEIIVVVDSPDDSTRPAALACAVAEPRLRCLVSGYPPGPANAIRYGIDQAAGSVVVVTMADGSDDAAQIDRLADLVRGGAVLAAASRYAPGGRRAGGPMIKGLLSSIAGRTLHRLARTGTTDATNSFKAYRTDFVRQVGIDSLAGFAIGIELTAKARRLRLPVAEIPTVWRDRQAGRSGFRTIAWLPCYARWYLFAFGPPLRVAELRARCARRSRPAVGEAP